MSITATCAVCIGEWRISEVLCELSSLHAVQPCTPTTNTSTWVPYQCASRAGAATISTHQTPFKQSSPKTLLPLLIHGISNSKAKKTSSSGWAAPCAFSNNVFRHPTPGEAHILWHPAREHLVSAVRVRLSCGSSCRSHVCKRSCAVRCSFTADRSQ